MVHARGMTLIEALVALTLLGLLAAGLLASFSLAQRTYQQVVRADAGRWEVVHSQQFLRRLLEEAYPAEPYNDAGALRYGLEGGSDHLMVTAAAPRGLNGHGYYRYEVTLRSRPGAPPEWVVTSQLTGPRDGVETATETETLLTRVNRVEWSYLEPPPQDAPPSVEARWLDEWRGRRQLPLLIRARVMFPPGDARSWPEMLVAPRITDNARCVFDAVSQRCREPAG
jgi:general secretion pathway protein J